MNASFWRIWFFLALTMASWGFLKDVSGIPSSWMPNDKVMHLLIFFVLTTLFQASFQRPWLVPVALMAIYGALIEVLQGMTPVRSADPLDWLADMVGVALALLVWPKMKHWLVYTPADTPN